MRNILTQLFEVFEAVFMYCLLGELFVQLAPNYLTQTASVHVDSQLQAAYAGELRSGSYLSHHSQLWTHAHMNTLMGIFLRAQQVSLSPGCWAFQDGAEEVYPGAHVNHSTLVLFNTPIRCQNSWVTAVKVDNWQNTPVNILVRCRSSLTRTESQTWQVFNVK